MLNFVLLRPILQIFVHVLPMESPPPPRGNSLAGMGVAALLFLSNLSGSPIWEHGDWAKLAHLFATAKPSVMGV